MRVADDDHAFIVGNCVGAAPMSGMFGAANVGGLTKTKFRRRECQGMDVFVKVWESWRDDG